MSAPNFMAIHPEFIEVFYFWPAQVQRGDFISKQDEAIALACKKI